MMFFANTRPYYDYLFPSRELHKLGVLVLGKLAVQSDLDFQEINS